MSTLPTFLGVNLVTPKGVIAHTETAAIIAPGELGEFELLPGHVPLLTSLRPGVLTLGEKSPQRYAVSTGYLRVETDGSVEILVEQADAATSIKVDDARNDLKAAETELAKWADKPTDGEWQNIQHRIAWAKARLDAAAH